MADEKWLSEDEQRAWRGYLHMRTLLTAQIGRDLADDSGLSDPDYTVLSNLSEAERHRWRLNELAARMLWSKSRLSHHIDRMQERGLVAREDCVSDGRGAFVVLTPNGLRAIKAAAPPHVASVRRHFIGLLTPAEIDTLSVIASKVVDHFSEQASVTRPTAPA